MDIYKIVDIVKAWVEKRNAAYLAKEDAVVYYANFTNRKSGFEWYTLTLQQLARVISATELSGEDSDKLKTGMIVTACQELGRVYQFGIRSPHKVVSRDVFNYLSEGGEDLSDTMVYNLAEELYRRNVRVMLMEPIWDMLKTMCRRLDLDFKERVMRVVLQKHMPKFQYELKMGAYRPLVAGKKRPAIMMIGSKPSEYMDIGEGTQIHKDILAVVMGSLK